jgi:glycosyltransferase involved in cell wall biosynthesis
MPESPLVTIVVPAYNHGRYLGQCLDSILAQSYRTIETIVIDDGSSDDTRSILKRYDGRVRWESQANAGQSAALNRGWALSRGDILGYLSADDALDPAAVAAAVEQLAARPDVVAVYPDFVLIDEDSQIVRRVSAPEFDRRDLILDLVCQPGPGAFFRRQAWEQAGPWNPALRQNPDLDFWMRLALQGEFVRIPKFLASFRVHRASQTWQRADEARADEPVAIVAGLLARPDLPSWVRAEAGHARASAFIASAQLHAYAGRLWRAGGAMMSALREYPARVFSIRTLRIVANALFGRAMFHLRALRGSRA